jgi:hypothetical protein
MVSDAATGSPSEFRCMWCSALLPSDHETVCPSCGATLVGEREASVPGLTAIDADAILRAARQPRGKARGGRLLSWISGEYDEGEGEESATPGSLAPPPADVRREMLRLELQAQVANAQAEAEALAADAALEGGASLAPPPPAEPPSAPPAEAQPESAAPESAGESGAPPA